MSAAVTTAPEATDAQILTVETTARLVPGTATEVSITARDHAFTIDEPAELGGTDVGANPVEHLLAALGSCQVITYQVWAGKLGLKVDTVDVKLSGDIDLRGFFGLDSNVRPGFDDITVDVTVTGPEAQEKYEELVQTVERHCPVLDNLASTVRVAGLVSVNGNQIRI